jgi:hypothetical protein
MKTKNIEELEELEEEKKHFEKHELKLIFISDTHGLHRSLNIPEGNV